jgi:hypothetical protein
LLLLVFITSSHTIAEAAVTLDRSYLLGEAAGEGGAAGIAVGSGNQFGLSFDSFGEPSAGNLQDLSPFGGPSYIRRGAHAGGASLDLKALLNGRRVPEPTTTCLMAIAAALFKCLCRAQRR